LKCALSVLGICDDYLPEPFFRFSAEQRKEIETRLEQLDMVTFTENHL
jgi:4-hydroxy-tetrahydrodipicolinate synthase